MHLEHRVVQRLLGRFLSQGFLRHELTRACVVLTDEALPRVIGLGRLSLYGAGAARLHDEVVAVAAEWVEPSTRGQSKLKPLNQTEKKEVLGLLEESLATPRLLKVSEVVKNRLQAFAAQDVKELIPHLNRYSGVLTERAVRDLRKRGDAEAKAMVDILNSQRTRILQTQEELHGPKQQMLFPAEEGRQLEADKRHWAKRLSMIDTEIVEEPDKIRASYEVKATRVEPVGLVYLWPVSG